MHTEARRTRDVTSRKRELFEAVAHNVFRRCGWILPA